MAKTEAVTPPATMRSERVIIKNWVNNIFEQNIQSYKKLVFLDHQNQLSNYKRDFRTWINDGPDYDDVKRGPNHDPIALFDPDCYHDGSYSSCVLT